MSVLDNMRQLRAAKKAELDELLAAPTAEKRDLNADESTKFDVLVEEVRKLDERIDELEEQEKRAAAAAAVQPTGPAYVTDPEVYAKGNRRQSYFRDLAKATFYGDRDAGDRLLRHGRQIADTPEYRALGNTNTTGGSGGLVLLAAA